jgi:aldose 1-epimerase
MDAAKELTRALSGAQWTIAADGHEAVVVEVGGGLREYRCDGVDLVDGYGPDELCPVSAGHILAPWPNRIRDGRYTFDGVAYQLPITEPSRHTAIHGLVNWTRWRHVASTPDSVTVEHDLVPRPGYPWPLGLRTTWAVGAGGLTATHEVTNQGGAPAPFGLAAHPYLRVEDVRVDDLTLAVPAASRLLVDGRLLPIGAARITGTDLDFADGRRLAGIALDDAFGDLSRDEAGHSTVLLTGPDGRGVACWADSAFTWWQVVTGDSFDPPRRRRSVGVEPMTCPPDAFRSGRDMIVLAPGETWRGTWGIRPVGA